MASSAAVSAALKMLARVFAGEVTSEKVAMYAAALDDLSDQQVAASVATLVRHHDGQFLPVPAQLRRAVGADHKPSLNVEATLNAIEQLGHYLPNSGWNWPAAKTVREHLGAPIAEAYASVGGAPRLSAQDETSRMIALRDFAQALREASREVQPAMLPIAKPTRLLTGTPLLESLDE